MSTILGTWGGLQGNRWDDGPFTGIKQISLSHKDALGSFQVKYNERMGDNHPIQDSTGFKSETIAFDDDEIITEISGIIGRLPRLPVPSDVVLSLTFKTNYDRTFGPYGNPNAKGKDFSLPIEKGKIVGFKGVTGTVLSAIGLYLS